MKLNLDRLNRMLSAIGGRPAVEGPVFGAPVETPLAERARDRLKKPTVIGGAIIGVFVLGLGLWAAVTPIWGAVVAPAAVRVEANRKTLKSREGGVVREINVRDGDFVRPNQVLIRFDDTVPRAQVEVLENQYDNALMQHARFRAEVMRQRTLPTPPELAAKSGDPRVAAIIANETLLFNSRLTAVEGQAAILNQRFEQLQSARAGLNVQVESIDQQVALIQQELDGYRQLMERGFAPRTLILRYERQLAEIAGRRGALAADIQRNQQAAGETRLQLAQLYEQRATEAADGLRESEARLADLAPRLDSARQSLAQTEVRSPDAGYVLNLSQFTIGGVAGSGETLMDIVPANAPLVVAAHVRPQDIDEVRPGMPATVSLTAFSSQRVPPLEAEVLTVSADALTDEQSGLAYFRVDVRIKPTELTKLPRGARLNPGMPATVQIRTSRRTVMSFLTGPMGSMLRDSLREQ